MGLKSARHLKEQLAKAAGVELEDPAYVVIGKANERRITMGVMYQPDVPDAHDEYSTADDLEDGVHAYMQGGDLKLRKQHDVTQVVGDVVGMISWPFEHEVELRSATGLEKSRTVTLPAGTVYATVKWTPEAWPLVKSGKIRGYSMGGAAVRLRT